MDGPSPENPADVIGRIVARRIAAGDSAIETMPEDAEGAIEWVVKHPAASPKMAAEDVLDCLHLVGWLHVIADHRELGLLHRIHSRKVSVTWQAAATALGLNTRQGAQARYMRLETHRAGLDEHTEAALRRNLAAKAEEEGWLESHQGQIWDAAKQIVATSPDGAPDVADVLDDPESVTLHELMSYLDYEFAMRGLSPAACPFAAGLVAEWKAQDR